MIAPGSDQAKRIDASLEQWRQGDLALEESWFVHVGDGAEPLSAASAEVGEGVQALTSEVFGLAVVTQTCDIVRSCVDRPYIEVAPLVRVDDDVRQQVKRGRMPRLASLPAVDDDSLVVDLDRVMTVEKAIVAAWKRTPGYVRDEDGRAFAQALARKRVRFAFPDDFTRLASKLQGRLVSKHEKDSVEGQALRALREIRVCAAPSWDAAAVEVFIWFIRHETDAAYDGKTWATHLSAWLELVPATGRFATVNGQVATMDEMTAADYVDSDPLDLDHLSTTGSD